MWFAVVDWHLPTVPVTGRRQDMREPRGRTMQLDKRQSKKTWVSLKKRLPKLFFAANRCHVGPKKLFESMEESIL